jgi:quinol-cytochrome oxidoreductase complex cytochrome b subunit
MRDVNYGWLIRYLHSNTASFFFLFVYLHIARGLYYGSYKEPRVLLWSIGVVIFLLMIITAFLGNISLRPIRYMSIQRSASTRVIILLTPKGELFQELNTTVASISTNPDSTTTNTSSSDFFHLML